MGKGEAATKSPKTQTPIDPHVLAAEMIAASPDTRIPGTEALQSLSPDQKMRNYATAAGLIGFVTFVWWYSMNAVGGSRDGFENLQVEAAEAREVAEKKSLGEKEAEDIADLEVTIANLEATEMGDEMMVAVAAPEEIAQMEEDNHATAALKKEV